MKALLQSFGKAFGKNSSPKGCEISFSAAVTRQAAPVPQEAPGAEEHPEGNAVEVKEVVALQTAEVGLSGQQEVEEEETCHIVM